MKRLPVIDRLLSRVDTSDPKDCWTWPGADNGVGYGVIGSGGHSGSNVYTHRVAYEHIIGPIPPGLVLDHLCRNRRCCNPTHLEPVTHRTNLRRGIGVTAQNAAKTHCPSMHAYDSGNTYIYPSGQRRCMTCAREYQRRLRARRRQAVA